MITPDDITFQALNTNVERCLLFQIEDECAALVQQESALCVESPMLLFPPMSSFRRLLIHKTAERFKLNSESIGWGSERQTIVSRTKDSFVPGLRYSDFIVYKTSSQLTKKIKLDNTNGEALPQKVTPADGSTILEIDTSELSSGDHCIPASIATHQNLSEDTILATSATATDTNIAKSYDNIVPINPEMSNPNTSKLIPSNIKSENCSTTTTTSERKHRGRGASKFRSTTFADNDNGTEISHNTEPLIDSVLHASCDDSDNAKLNVVALTHDYSNYLPGNPVGSSSRNKEIYGTATHEHILVTTQAAAPQIVLDRIREMLAKYLRHCKIKHAPVTKDDSIHNYYIIFKSVSLAQEVLLELHTAKKLDFLVLPAPLVVEKKELQEEPRPTGKTTTRVAKRLIGNALDLPL
jgi:hypothetical protein